jgi:hypothetical protein
VAGHIELAGTATPEPELLESRREPVPSTRHRWSWWWVLAVVVLGAVAWRPVADWLATVQTRHIVEAYAVESELRSARASTIADLQFQLVVGEEQLFASTIAGVNREQAQRLRRLAKRLRDDSWWTVDRRVQRTADQVRAALLMEAGTLERAGTRIADETAILDAPTLRALFDLSDPVLRLAASFDVAVPSRRDVRFAAADALRDRVSARIRADVPLHLVLTGLRQSAVIDLRDGEVATTDNGFGADIPLAAAVLPPRPGSPAGEIAVTTIDGVTAVALDGGSRRDLGPGLVLPRAGDGAWLVSGLDVATVAAGGAPVHLGTLPPESDPVRVPQPGNRLLLSTHEGIALWNPRSGAQTGLSGPSDAPEVLGATATSVVWTRLPRQEPTRSEPQPVSAVEVTDTATGRTRHLPLSPPLPGVVPVDYGPATRSYVAPDGSGLAVAVPDYPSATHYVDLRTGRTRLLVEDAEPLAWSRDGHWLALATRGLFQGGSETFLVRLWSPGSPVVTAARATFELETANAALVP